MMVGGLSGESYEGFANDSTNVFKQLMDSYSSPGAADCPEGNRASGTHRGG